MISFLFKVRANAKRYCIPMSPRCAEILPRERRVSDVSYVHIDEQLRYRIFYPGDVPRSSKLSLSRVRFNLASLSKKILQRRRTVEREITLQNSVRGNFGSDQELRRYGKEFENRCCVLQSSLRGESLVSIRNISLLSSIIFVKIICYF